MKRLYIQPTLEVVLIKMEQSLLAGSLGVTDIPDIDFDDVVDDDTYDGLFAD